MLDTQGVEGSTETLNRPTNHMAVTPWLILQLERITGQTEIGNCAGRVVNNKPRSQLCMFGAGFENGGPYINLKVLCTNREVGSRGKKAHIQVLICAPKHVCATVS